MIDIEYRNLMGFEVELVREHAFQGRARWFLRGAWEKWTPKFHVTFEPGEGSIANFGPGRKPCTWEVDGQELQAAIESVETVPFHLHLWTAGLDGESATLKIRRGPNGITYYWWMALPEEWRGLRKLLALLDRPPRRVEGELPD